MCVIVQYRRLVPFEAATNSSGPGSSRQSKLTLKYSELVICFPIEQVDEREIDGKQKKDGSRGIRRTGTE